MPRCEVEILLRLVSNELGSVTLVSICASGSWLCSPTNECGNRSRVLEPPVDGSMKVSPVFWFESWLWPPAREVMAIFLVFGREVEDWLGRARVEAIQESTLSVGDIS